MTTENRSTFFARLNHLPREDRMRLELAYTLAKFAHRAQTRKELDTEGNPLRYFEHPRRVAIILMDELGLASYPEMIIAALLHDSVEDTRDLTDEVVDFHFGSVVAHLVRCLTKTEANKETYTDNLHRFAPWQALAIKAADRLDNLRSMDNASKEFIAKQVAETKVIYGAIFRRMVDIAPPQHRAMLSKLEGSIHHLTYQLEVRAQRMYAL